MKEFERMNSHYKVASERASVGAGAEAKSIVLGTPGRLHTLDSLRGLAALVVVIHHCLLLQPAFSDHFFSNWNTVASTPAQFLLFNTPLRLIWYGYEAVTLFFVLSGLVLALPWVERRPPSYTTFCIKRIGRIYLPYCAIIIIAGFLNAILQPYFSVPGGSHWVNTMTWSNPVTIWDLAEHALMIGHQFSINGAVHSLTFEMRVSLIFPILMLPLLRWRLMGALGLAAFLIVFATVIHLVTRFLFGNEPSESPVVITLWDVKFTAYVSLFFVLGATIALYLAEIRSILARTTPYGGWACMVIGFLVFQAHWTQDRQLQQVAVAAGAALMIVAALAPGSLGSALSHPWFRFLGRISYSVYLVHIPLLLASTFLLQSVLPLWAMLLIIPPASLVLGWLFHVAIAEPCVQISQRLAADREIASLRRETSDIRMLNDLRERQKS